MQAKTADDSAGKTVNGMTWKSRFLVAGIFQTAFVVIYLATRQESHIPDWWDLVLMLLVSMVAAPMGLYSLFRYALIKHDEDKAAQAGEAQK
ncbi:hypothetical protein [Thalassospira xiamenensis]|jgi:hypothetical protein|uniref:hypothetical protein n=1 Tax=Thalassospira xiamenensis TaxID=220697 RepID=UPI001FFEA682|nr:hypothetical protein [Thalassospira xiamenensis]MCK2169134.1 hypothetical protein [Thalassospira xiamenensis]